MTPGAGILVLGRGHINHILKMHYFYKNRFLYSQAQIRQTKYVVIMNKEESTEIVNFMIPESGVLVIGRGHISHIVKMHYFFKNFLLYSKAWIRKTQYIVMITKEAYTKFVNFMTPRAGVLVLGRGHISYIVKMHYFFKIFFSTARH